jgi:hypothetical protein
MFIVWFLFILSRSGINATARNEMKLPTMRGFSAVSTFSKAAGFTVR